MKTAIDCILFEFDPVCSDCQCNQNDDESEATLQSTIRDISYSGWPTCMECGSELNIEEECEVRA